MIANEGKLIKVSLNMTFDVLGSILPRADFSTDLTRCLLRLTFHQAQHFPINCGHIHNLRIKVNGVIVTTSVFASQI